MSITVRPVPARDELFLIGAEELAYIPVPTAVLAASVGRASVRDDDALPGLGSLGAPARAITS